MVSKRNGTVLKVIDYCKDCGIEVKTSTKARGHQGVFLYNSKDLKRIDISKKLDEDKIVPVVVHEFTHFFHQNLDENFESLEKIFGVKSEILFDELYAVTAFAASNSVELKIRKEIIDIKSKIKEQEDIIKIKYPNFKRSKKFVEFEKYIKNSDAKYLLKYDRVKVFSWFKYIVYSVDTVLKDFPQMPKEFAAYINLRSLQRRQARYSNKYRKLRKYYEKPSELFARFVEGLVIDKDKVKDLAPVSYAAFMERLEFRSFQKLRGILDLVWDKEA